jgi:hypothetical protein
MPPIRFPREANPLFALAQSRQYASNNPDAAFDPFLA